MNEKREVLLHFIQVYRSFPALWDINSKNYNDRNEKAKCYHKLVEILRKIEPSSTRETVVKKINSLRSNFRKEIRKYEDFKLNNPDKEFTPSLWYFDEFLFLTNYEDMHCNKSYDIEYCKVNVEKENEESSDNLSSSYSKPTEDINFTLDIKPQKYITEENTTTDVQWQKIKKRRISFNPEENTCTSIQCNRTVTEVEDDDFLIMAKYYVQKLKKMKSRQRLFADRLINEVLLEGQLGTLTRYTSIIDAERNGQRLSPESQ